MELQAGSSVPRAFDGGHVVALVGDLGCKVHRVVPMAGPLARRTRMLDLPGLSARGPLHRPASLVGSGSRMSAGRTECIY